MRVPKGKEVITYIQRALVFHITVVKATEKPPPQNSASLYMNDIALHCCLLDFPFSPHLNGCDFTRLQLLPWTSTP